MRKLLILFLSTAYSFVFSQISEFKKADDIYTKKINALIKKEPEETLDRIKKEKVILDEKLISYKLAIEKIQEEEKKNITEFPAPSVPKISKDIEFELGTKKLKDLLYSEYVANISSLSNFISANDYNVRLVCTVDSKGYVYDARVKGKNQNINTFILAAFYKIKNKGTWKPAEVNGMPILYAYALQIPIKFADEESDFNE